MFLAPTSEQTSAIGLVGNNEYATFLTDDYGLLNHTTLKGDKSSGVREAAQGDTEHAEGGMAAFQFNTRLSSSDWSLLCTIAEG